MTIRRIAPLAALAALVAVVAAGCGGGGKVSSVNAAVVNGEPITKVQVQALLDQAKKAYTTQKRTFPVAGSAAFTTLRNQALDFLVRRAEYAQKAKELDVKVTDAQIQARLAQVKQQYGTQAKYDAQLKSQGLTDQDVRDQVRSDLLAQGIFDKVTGKVTVSDAEIKAYYDKNKKLFTQPRTRTVRHILVSDKALALKLYKQAVAGADFGTLAKKYSIDTGSKPLGGKLTIAEGQTVPQFDKVAFQLKTGAISPPVQTQYGWHVIKAETAITPAHTQPLAQVKSTISQQLLQTKKNDVITRWANDVKTEYEKKIKYADGYAAATAGATSSSSGTSTGG